MTEEPKLWYRKYMEVESIGDKVEVRLEYLKSDGVVTIVCFYRHCDYVEKLSNVYRRKSHSKKEFKKMAIQKFYELVARHPAFSDCIERQVWISSLE